MFKIQKLHKDFLGNIFLVLKEKDNSYRRVLISGLDVLYNGFMDKDVKELIKDNDFIKLVNEVMIFN